MERSPEMRHDERFPCRTSVEWGYFNKTEKYSARMLNYSETGAGFECPQPLISGATILVRLEANRAECGSECRDGDKCPWPRLISLGEVRWCRDLAGIGPKRFGVGVRFHPPT